MISNYTAEMTNSKLLIAPLAATLLSSCASIAGVTPHVARPGYICTIRESFLDGVWASATLDEDGSQIRASWGWRGRKFASATEIRVESEVAGTESLRADVGRAAISTKALKRSGRNKPHRLELSTDPNAPFLRSGQFAGGFARIEGFRLQTNWADLLAFSRGASRLTLIARDNDGNITDRVDLAPSIIANGVHEVQPVLDQLAKLTSDFRNRCEHVHDVAPVIIAT